MKRFTFISLAALIATLISCDSANSPRGFSLPEGNAEQGIAVVHKYQCLSCHQIEGLQPLPSLMNNPDLSVRLGGPSNRVKTYADLLTSVINPSHKLAKGYPLVSIQEAGVSKMQNYNDVMTVAELIDLVTYLQSNYELVPYQRTNYQYYGNK